MAQVRLAVLVIEPLSRLLIASALPHLVQQRPSGLHAGSALTRLRRLGRGTLVEAARVTAVERGGLYASFQHTCLTANDTAAANEPETEANADTETGTGKKTRAQRHQFTAWIPVRSLPHNFYIQTSLFVDLLRLLF